MISDTEEYEEEQDRWGGGGEAGWMWFESGGVVIDQ